MPSKLLLALSDAEIWADKEIALGLDALGRTVAVSGIHAAWIDDLGVLRIAPSRPFSGVTRVTIKDLDTKILGSLDEQFQILTKLF
jgi:hypothetical protein